MAITAFISTPTAASSTTIHIPSKAIMHEVTEGVE